MIMKKVINVRLIGVMLFSAQVGLAFTPTAWDAGYAALTGLGHVITYEAHKKDVQALDDKIDFCIANNAHLYTPEAREYIQQYVSKCGVTATVTPISGIVMDKEEISFAVIAGKDNHFYLNIPFAWVSFLNDTLKKMENNETLAEAESAKLESFSFLIAHEMNHVKKIVTGTSFISREYPLKKSLATAVLTIGAGLYLAHEHKIPYLHQYFMLNVPVALTIAAIKALYLKKGLCDEEYACDSEGIDNVKHLRGGKKWMLTDCKNWVDEFFAKKPAWIQSWYAKYPNALCSLLTNHPHPIERAERLQEKIVELEGQNANTYEIA